jgi:pimeloyl-ACP methyl ester carboxylesterase
VSALLATTFEVHGGRRVRVARLGRGAPIVLLHGYPENLQLFSALAPLLAETHEVIAFDWPGMGRSEEWPGGTTPWHQAERLRTLLEAWRLGPVTLVGTDMGGQPALVLAAEHPEHVGRLVVMNALVAPHAETSWEIRLLRRFRFNERALRLLPRAVFWRAAHTSLPSGVRLPAALRADLREAFRQPAVRRFVSRMCGGYQGSLPRLPALFPAVRCPTLVLWAEHDRHFPLVHARELHAGVSGSRLVVVPGAEHWMPWHRAEETARAILAHS